MLFENLISSKTIKKYVKEAYEAAEGLGVIIHDDERVIEDLDKLCYKLNGDIDNIRKYSEILLDSIAIKNAAILYDYLKRIKRFEIIEWYKDDAKFGINTYPLLLNDTVVFPKQWIIDAITSGKQNRFSELYLKDMEDI